jgi:DNA-directed RNA polymerase omega subunit
MHIPEDVGSKYRLIVLAGERVSQLKRGALPRIKNPQGKKLTTIAVEEVSSGLVNFREREDLGVKIPAHQATPTMPNETI